MKSVISVVMGVFLALGVGLLAVFGIVWPVFMTFFDPELARNAAFGEAVLVFAAAFSFYWGGMFAGYRAPSRRRLHGTLVAPAAFVISPALNLATGEGLFPGLDSPAAVGAMLGILAVSVGAAYFGARRSEALYVHNRDHARKRELRRGRRRRQGQEG